MSRPVVVLTRPFPRDLHARALDLLEGACEVVPWDGPIPMPREELARALARAEAVVATGLDPLDAAMIAGAPRLKIIANMAVGYENVDLQAAADRGIVVTNTAHAESETVADLAIGMLISTARRVMEGDRLVRGGRWEALTTAASLMGKEITGTTLGIVGLGRIGRALARRAAAAFSMRVLYADTAHTDEMRELEAKGTVQRTELRRLLAESDYVSLHTTLNPSSTRLIGADALASMKPGSILVNTARGKVVDTDALVDALRRGGPLRAAALDVTDPEPLPEGHPLRTLPNVLVTPHVGAQTPETRGRMSETAAKNVVAVLAGKPPVTPVPMPPPAKR